MIEIKLHIFEDDFDEEFTSSENKERHYKKHVIDKREFSDISADEYEEIADKLQRTPIDNKNIFGYLSKNRSTGKVAYCKYDKQNNYFVVYNYFDGEPKTISLYTKTPRKYDSEKYITDEEEYYGEIPNGK